MITRDLLAAKLNPSKVRVSPRFTAMLAFFLDQHGWTEPEVKTIEIDRNGDVWVDRHNSIEAMFSTWQTTDGTADDLDRNLRGVAATVHLTSEETDALLRFARERVTRLDA